MGDRGEEERRWSQNLLSDAQGKDKRQWALTAIQKKKDPFKFLLLSYVRLPY